VEFSIDRGSKLRNLPYARLRSVAGNSWHEREELVLTTKNVERGTAVKRLGEQKPRESQPLTDTDDPKPPLAPGEAGTAQMEFPFAKPTRKAWTPSAKCSKSESKPEEPNYAKTQQQVSECV
jgi:hypothetical protein